MTDGQYPLPNGGALPVIDVATASRRLGALLARYRDGSTEQVFFAGDQPRPEGVILAFGQWADYDAIKQDAESDRRHYDLVRQRLADDDPSKWVTYEEMIDEWGLDPDSPDLVPKAEAADAKDNPDNR